LRSRGVEVIERELAVIRRGLGSPRPLAALTAALARDAAALTGLVRRREVALIHSNTSVVLGGAVAAAAARIPHVWHVREIYARYARMWPAHRRLLLTAAALPCVSRATAAEFGDHRRVRVIYDGLAVDAHRAPRDAARRALGLRLADGVPVIAVLGRISDWKGQDVLVRALAAPPLRDLGAIGLLAGEPWPGAQARQDQVLSLARELGVTDRLRLAGFVSDVNIVYGAADLIAVPSTSPDPLPNSAIEAAAAGCTVIAAAHGGLPEIIADGRTGRLFAPGDAAALARIAAELLVDPEQRVRLGQAAATDARARFPAARPAAEIQSLYDELRC
jgi:glycosyltransferase involved in cell wall biosynthesis